MFLCIELPYTLSMNVSCSDAAFWEEFLVKFMSLKVICPDVISIFSEFYPNFGDDLHRLL